MKVIFSHPTGNQNSRNVSLALQKNEMLSQFYTTLGIFSDSYIQKFNSPIFREIQRRTYNQSFKSKITFYPWHEILRLLMIKTKMNSFFDIENSLFSSRNMYAAFDDAISKNFLKYDPDIVYGYNGCSMQTFLKAKSKNIKTLYDLPACHWRENYSILNKEKENKPEWAGTMDALDYSEEFLTRCDKELELADKIVVASSFCKKSLELYPEKLNQIKIIPYGFPEPYKSRIYKKNAKLKVLFVGALNQQKGISYLFDAIEPFKNQIELTLIGSLPSKKHTLLENEIKKHTYLGTLPHNEVLKIMREHDLLIFPSIMDAFGMVITEAMAQGTPVITTTSSAGPELIKHNENGWIVKPSDSEAIKNILESILMKNNISEIGYNSLLAAEKRTWVDYQNDIITFVKSLE